MIEGGEFSIIHRRRLISGWSLNAVLTGSINALSMENEIMSNNEIENLQNAIDLVSETNILMSVKQTDFYIGIGNNKRYGRFRMDSLEHKILKKKEGYYFFMLFSGQYFLGAKIVKAEKLKFAKQISWRKIIELDKNFRNLEGYLNGET